MSSFNCATLGCRNTKRFGDYCGTCARAAGAKRTREIRSTVYPTGETRYSEEHDQVELTDGIQRWWSSAREAAA